MSEKIVKYYSNFSDYYQKTLLRRLIVGFILGSFLWISVFLLASLLNVIQFDLWWEIFLHELPLLGAILALIVTLQIWGLLPQPANEEDEQLSSTTNKEKKNMNNEDINKEETDSVNNEDC